MIKAFSYLKTNLKQILYVVLILLIGIGIGYYLLPKPAQNITQIQNQTQTQKQHETQIERIIKKPDGTIINEKIQKHVKESKQSNYTKQSIQTTPEKKMGVKILYQIHPQPNYGLEIDYFISRNISIGVWGMFTPQSYLPPFSSYGVSVGITF